LVGIVVVDAVLFVPLLMVLRDLGRWVTSARPESYELRGCGRELSSIDEVNGAPGRTKLELPLKMTPDPA